MSPFVLSITGEPVEVFLKNSISSVLGRSNSSNNVKLEFGSCAKEVSIETTNNAMR